MEFKCEECNKWIDAEEYGYGHDCTPDEEVIFPNIPLDEV